MRSTGHFDGTFVRRAVYATGSVAALAAAGTATASAATTAPPAHNAPVVRHTEGRSAGQLPPQGSPRRRSALEPVRPKALTWSQVQLIQSHRSDERVAAKSGLPVVSLSRS
jgi:hypothetical protein